MTAKLDNALALYMEGIRDGHYREAVSLAQNSGRSDTPDLNRSAPYRDKRTRRLRAKAPEQAGVSFKTRRGRPPGSKRPAAPAGEPTIRDIRPEDLADTERLFKLHGQFVDAGLASGGRAGELDFLALAHRAKVRGFNPGGMLWRLLQGKRTAWITITDEEAASRTRPVGLASQRLTVQLA